MRWVALPWLAKARRLTRPWKEPVVGRCVQATPFFVMATERTRVQIAPVQLGNRKRRYTVGLPGWVLRTVIRLWSGSARSVKAISPVTGS